MTETGETVEPKKVKKSVKVKEVAEPKKRKKRKQQSVDAVARRFYKKWMNYNGPFREIAPDQLTQAYMDGFKAGIRHGKD